MCDIALHLTIFSPLLSMCVVGRWLPQASKLLLKDLDIDSEVLNQLNQSFKGIICNTPLPREIRDIV